MDDDFNRRLARISVGGWPARETQWLGDWLLRFDEGVSGRANSALPLGPVGADAGTAVAAVEAQYVQRGLQPMFQMFEGAVPDDLDAILAERGYRRQSPSVFLIADTPQIGAKGMAGVEAEVSERATEAWAAVWSDGRPARDAGVRRGIFERVQPPRCFAVARIGDRPVSIGHGAVADGWGWFHGIQTVPDMRGRGLARFVLSRLAEWCRAHGAQRFYLQVERDNQPALAAYEKAGFRHAFDYWYRVLPTLTT